MYKNTEKKTIEFANFNCTFDDNTHLLNHLFDIVYPALTSDIEIKVNKDTSYTLDNVHFFNHPQYGYLLIGNYIKITQLDIYSTYDKVTRTLKEKDEHHPTSPYSIFIIILKNHRMLFYKNQKGSPRLTSLASTITKTIKRYLRSANKEKSYGDRLPGPIINIMPLPSQQSIDESFKNISKITKVKYSLVKLNGPTNFTNALSLLSSQFEEIDSSTADLTFSHPKNINNVKKQLNNYGIFAKPVIEAVTTQGDTVILTEDSCATKVPIDLPIGNSDSENTNQVLEKSLKYANIIDIHATISESEYNIAIKRIQDEFPNL